MRTVIAMLILVSPTLIGGYIHHRDYEPWFWERRSFWSFARVLALGLVVLLAVFLAMFGAKALMGIGGRADLPIALVGGGAAIVAFSRALLGRVGPAFTDVTEEYGSILGWLLLISGTFLVGITSGLR